MIRNALAQVVASLLKVCVNGSRAKHPVVTPDVMDVVAANKLDSYVMRPSSGSAIKKSNSTNFLSCLDTNAGDTNSNPKSINNGFGKKFGNVQPFTKPQAFKKAIVLLDNTRDDVRENVRTIFTALRDSLKSTSPGNDSNEAKEVSKFITFILSVENGFMWSDSYASLKIDELAKNSRIVPVLKKLIGLLVLPQTEVSKFGNEFNIFK